MQFPAETRQRLYDWIKTVVTILLVGPLIGGFVAGLLTGSMAVLKGAEKWDFIPIATMGSMAMSYLFGLPIGIVAVTLLLMLLPFTPRGTTYLAVLCAVTAAVLLFALVEIMRPPIPVTLQTTWTARGIRLVSFGIPSAISAWLCWRMTKRWHGLS